MSRTTLAVVLLIVALVAIACAPAPAAVPTAAPPAGTTAPTTAPAASTAAPLVKVNSSWSMTNADPAPLWVAQDVGFFKQNGLDVSLIFIDGGTKHAQALIAKSVDIGISSAAPVVSADAGGADLELIAGLVNRINYDFIVRPGIKSGADLKGGKVAISGPSGSSTTAMRIALKQLFNLDPDKDVVMITIGNETEREAALLSGQIDATIVNPDTSIKAKKDGLVVLETLWGKPIDYEHTGVATTRSFAEKNPQVVTAYLKSIIQAIGYMKDPSNKANVEKIIAKYLKSNDTEMIDQSYTRMSQTILQCAPYVTMGGMKTVISESKTAVKAGLTPEKASDNSYLKALDDSGFIKANCK
ncbi:MAG: ABC transporter substrate-binding protein [Chloroflexi bacterium]|nr:ABC transporter substrate-binding protein [Chloroflexota bacterium]